MFHSASRRQYGMTDCLHVCAALVALAGVSRSSLGQIAAPAPSVPHSAPAPSGFRAAPAAIVPQRSSDDQITFSVSFDDPSNLLAPYQAQIASHLLAAGKDWARYLGGTGSIEIVVIPGSVPRATGRSLTSGFVYNNGQYNVFDQGFAAEIRSGADPNGSTPDVEIVIGNDYLVNELWFDPDPLTRQAPVPTNRTDAYSVMLHELGHAIAFNGWRDSQTGSLPAGYESTYDERVFFDGTNFYIIGPRATALYGAPAPATYGNYTHLGNVAPRPGSDLISDLMNGVVFYRGSRYYISALDLAILADTGITLVPVCYANCDDSTAAPVLNVNDFICFQQKYAAGDSYANCDNSTAAPVLNINDFICFQQKFAAGCP